VPGIAMVAVDGEIQILKSRVSPPPMRTVSVSATAERSAY
jgi:hypothetical protein